MKLAALFLIFLTTMPSPYSVHATEHLRRQYHRDDRVLAENDEDRQLFISLTSCTTDNDCRDGYRCSNEKHPDLAITVCEKVELLPVNVVCNKPLDCESGTCHDGVCKIPFEKDCTNDVDCITGRCDDICLLPLQEGDTCDEATDCLSGLCANEKCVATCSTNSDCDLGLACLSVGTVGSFCVDLSAVCSDGSISDSTTDKNHGGDGSSVFDRDGDGARDNGFDGVPSSAPSVSNSPSSQPSLSFVPSSSPTETGQPSPGPTVPTGSPYPSPGPSKTPSMSVPPTEMPSLSPSLAPTEEMSMFPSTSPSSSPSELPSSIPSNIPSSFPSSMPSKVPTPLPTPGPTPWPTPAPTSCDTPNALLRVWFSSDAGSTTNHNIKDCPFMCMEYCRDDTTNNWDGWIFLPGRLCMCFLGARDPFGTVYDCITDFFDPAKRTALGL